LHAERLNVLTDGVYAIALTLLVLDLKAPEHLASGQLLPALIAEIPRFLIFLIAFSAGGIGWTFTYFCNALMDRGSGLHLFLTLGALVTVSLIPFTSALMGSYPDQPWGILAYALDIAALSGLNTVDLIVTGPEIIPPHVDRWLVRVLWGSSLACCLVALGCGAVALANPRLALGLIAFFTASIWIEFLWLAPWVARQAHPPPTPVAGSQSRRR
jgi:hypothetical protein